MEESERPCERQLGLAQRNRGPSGIDARRTSTAPAELPGTATCRGSSRKAIRSPRASSSPRAPASVSPGLPLTTVPSSQRPAPAASFARRIGDPGENPPSGCRMPPWFLRTTGRFQPGTEPEELMLQPGDVLQGRYFIERVLGQGGMGKVYLSRQLRLGGRAFAIRRSISTPVGPATLKRCSGNSRHEAEDLAMSSTRISSTSRTASRRTARSIS